MGLNERYRNISHGGFPLAVEDETPGSQATRDVSLHASWHHDCGKNPPKLRGPGDCQWLLARLRSDLILSECDLTVHRVLHLPEDQNPAVNNLGPLST